MTSSSPVAVLFDRLGPYHRARLEAAGRRLPVTAIEFAGDSTTYDWEKVRGAEHFERRTLFRDTDSESVPTRKLAAAVGSEFDSLRPSVVAVPGWGHPGALAALHWCADTSTPAIMMSESTATDFERRWWREIPKRRVVSTCQAGLVGGRRHRAYLVRLGIPKEAIFLGYDAVDNAHFVKGAARAREREDELRKSMALPEQFFLASGRFIPKKNFPRLIEAFNRYRRRASDRGAWDLVILGDGDERPAIEQAIATHEITDAVHLPGFRQYDELPQYYGLAGAFVHPSTREQWGLVVNEAMAAALPVLVSNRCGCAGELVEEGSNGYTFNPYDTGALADSLHSIAHGDVSLGRMGNHSQEIIADWGPSRFGEGFQQAVACAQERSASPGSWVDRALIKALMHR